MENKETIEGNKLIAEFDGWVIDNSFPDKNRTYSKNGNIELDTTFKYHTSWDWLMTVVEKIENLGMGYFSIENNKCEIVITLDNLGRKHFNNRFIDNTKIEAVYLAVIEFIKWYNENKEQ